MRSSLHPRTPPERLRLRDIRNTSTFRLTLLLGGVALIGVVMLTVLIYALSARELNARSDRILHVEATRLMTKPPRSLGSEVNFAISHNASGLNYYGLLDPRGRRIAGNLRGSSGFTPGHAREIPERAGRHGPIRLLAERLPTGEILLIGRDITPLVDLRWRVTIVLVVSALALALLIVGTAIALSLAPLRRVSQLQRTAHEIAAGHLDQRMPILGRGDELDLLAGTVNTMVDEVGRVIGQVKSVTDAIAHDLRTPLTRMRSHLDRARRQEDIDLATAERLDLVIADLDTVLERFTALLRISEIEAGSRRAGFAEVPLSPLLSSVRDLYQPLAEERGIALALETLPGAVVFGDQSLMFEALSNLVDNAIKFAPQGGQVSLFVSRDEKGLVVEVRDNGPGIAEDQRQSVLRRFDRGEATAQIPGSGLGLSVVVAIVHLHQFTLVLDDSAPGLIARILAPDHSKFPIQP
ncbi:HAMP domain-containing histidine kinase [Sphingomonas sp. CGMCC 1.13654]|uniref:histidine kinase n=1 Tax=Sphingomonas chungangi TaxID=2683589 RepID=A0A838LCF1_9SPHN|nr:HAMP domain-containing sensor histidine kinase [Sphingomonas chungangi]MBA2936530.1 HAMP domain-containing histidine kinase [Sphingomonas chungangi]MVW55915.1 HAMP domain-containing protein [Sphingomonas chungangi]